MSTETKYLLYLDTQYGRSYWNVDEEWFGSRAFASEIKAIDLRNEWGIAKSGPRYKNGMVVGIEKIQGEIHWSEIP